MASNEEIKTFKIGKEEVRVDDLLHNIMLGADRFIRTRKESERDAIHKAYLTLMERLEKGDNSLYLDEDENGNLVLIDSYNLIKNDEFNSFSKVLGYMLPIMEYTKRYVKPTETLAEYNTKLFGKDLMSELFGGNETNINNFILLDADDKNNINGIENRKSVFLNTLNTVHNRAKAKYKNYDNQSNIDRINEIFNNGLSGDEYYELGKLTGIPDIYKYFQTGSYLQEQSQLLQNPYLQFLTWLELTHPYEIVDLVFLPVDFSQTFTQNDTFNEDYFNQIYDEVNAISLDGVVSIIDKFSKGDSELKDFVPAAIDRLESENQLLKLDSNLYAIPQIQTSNKGTVYTWDSKNQILKEVNVHTIPYYQQLYLKEYQLQVLGQPGINYDIYNNYGYNFVTSNKKGGIIKAQRGIVVPEWFTSLFNQLNLTGWDSNLDSSNWTAENTPHGYAGDINKRYELNEDYTSGNQIGSDILSFVNSGTYNNVNSFIDDYNNSAETIRTFWNTDRLYGDIGASDLNTLYKRMFASRSGEDSSLPGYIGFQDDQKDKIGSNTWLRTMDLYEKEYDDLTDEEKKSRVHKINIGGKEYQVYKKANGDLGIVEQSTLNDQQLNNISLDQKTTIIPENNNSNGIEGKSENSVFNLPSYEAPSKVKFDITPTISDISRYLLSLGYNDSIKDLEKKAVPLNLKNPYELYSPVTGAFGEMNMYNLQAAALRNKALELYTSDPEKNAAIFAEYNKYANQLELQGFIADNKEIRRTSEAARERQEKNIALRNTIANYNTEQINNFNAKLNRIEAAYKAKNFESTNNLLKSLENQITDYTALKKEKEEEQRLLKNAVTGGVSLRLSRELYQNALNSAKQAEIIAGDLWTKEDRELSELYKKRILDIYKALQMYSEYVKAGANPNDLTEIAKIAQTPIPSYYDFVKKYKSTIHRMGGVLQTIKTLKR